MNENNAAQAAVNTIIAQHFSDDPAGAARALIVVNQVLSKLRAPVADERAAFERRFRIEPENWSTAGGGGYRNVWYEARWEGWKARAALASAPVAGEAHTALNEWFDKTDFIQKRIASGELPVKYLGWHRADVMRDLIDAATQNQMIPSGCILVQEADTIPHTHPEYGPGIFFTEDAKIEFNAAPQASEAVPVAWAIFSPSGNIRYWHHDKSNVDAFAAKHGLTVCGLANAGPTSKDAEQIADLVLGHAEGLRVSSLLESGTGFGKDVEHRFQVSNGEDRYGVVIILTALSAQPGAQKTGGSDAN